MSVPPARQAPALVLITDPAQPLARTLDVARRAAAALPPGTFAVQLRDKAASTAALRDVLAALREATQASGAPVLLNVGDDARTPERGLLAAQHADGAHTPQVTRLAELRARLPASAVLTTAAHDDADVQAAARAGADAVLVSPVFASPGKAPPRGVAALASARALGAGRVAVLALGGVDAAGAPACAAAGAHGVAVIRALYDAALRGDVEAVAAALAAPFAGTARG